MARVARSESKRKKQRRARLRKLLTALIILAFILAVIFAMQGSNPFEGIHLPSFNWSVSSTPSATQPGASPAPVPSPSQAEPVLDIYVIDVGQGDSALLVSPSGKTMLIDAGESTAMYSVRSLIKSLGIKKLDAVIATHPHSDHIGGMPGILRSFEVDRFYMPEVSNPSSDYSAMVSALNSASLQVNYLSAGRTSSIEWDDGIAIDILSPFDDVAYQSINDYSVIMRVTYGGTSMLFTGDAEGNGAYSAEYTALARNSADKFRCTVIKVPHHGSLYSLSDAFLAAAAPEYAVISVGSGNDYGHPHQSTLDKLENCGIEIFRTDKLGTLHIALNGETASISALQKASSGGIFSGIGQSIKSLFKK